MTTRTPVEVNCGDCRHAWVAAHAPMEMGKFARLLSRAAKAGCPMCSGTKIFMGPGKPGPTTGGAT
jgi:hypothetical protein